jgi:hypothetical protein
MTLSPDTKPLAAPDPTEEASFPKTSSGTEFVVSSVFGNSAAGDSLVARTFSLDGKHLEAMNPTEETAFSTVYDKPELIVLSDAWNGNSPDFTFASEKVACQAGH